MREILKKKGNFKGNIFQTIEEDTEESIDSVPQEEEFICRTSANRVRD